MGNNLEEKIRIQKEKKEKLIYYFIEESYKIKGKYLENPYISENQELTIHKTFNSFGEWYLMSYTKDNSSLDYILREIEIKSETELTEIKRQLAKLEILHFNKNLGLQLYHYKIQDKVINQKIHILFEQNPLNKTSLKEFLLLESNNNISEKDNWNIFIYIIINLKLMEINKIMIENLIPDNININHSFTDNFIQLIGYKTILDKIELYKDFCPYFSPEKILNKKSSTKSIMWSLGCILFELFFHKQAFMTNNDILNMKYKLDKNLNKELGIILSKLLCSESERLTLDELLHESIIIDKMIEMSYFYRFAKNNLMELGFENLDTNKHIQSNKYYIIFSIYF